MKSVSAIICSLCISLLKHKCTTECALSDWDGNVIRIMNTCTFVCMKWKWKLLNQQGQKPIDAVDL